MWISDSPGACLDTPRTLECPRPTPPRTPCGWTCRGIGLQILDRSRVARIKHVEHLRTTDTRSLQSRCCFRFSACSWAACGGRRQRSFSLRVRAVGTASKQTPFHRDDSYLQKEHAVELAVAFGRTKRHRAEQHEHLMASRETAQRNTFDVLTRSSTQPEVSKCLLTIGGLCC